MRFLDIGHHHIADSKTLHYSFESVGVLTRASLPYDGLLVFRSSQQRCFDGLELRRTGLQDAVVAGPRPDYMGSSKATCSPTSTNRQPWNVGHAAFLSIRDVTVHAESPTLISRSKKQVPLLKSLVFFLYYQAAVNSSIKTDRCDWSRLGGLMKIYQQSHTAVAEPQLPIGHDDHSL